MKKTLTNFDVSYIKNKKILLRLDLNVPLNKGIITDDSRIRAILPTINYLRKHQGKIIILSHLGRVKKKEDCSKLSLKIVSERLSTYLKNKVIFIPETRGKLLEENISQLKSGDVLLMENTRFEDIDNKKESNNDFQLGKYWSSLGEVFINDAFGICHRSNASNVGIAEHISQKCFGFLIEKEINFLEKIMNNPKRPLIGIMGGSKVSDKIKIIKNILKKVDFLLIGGGMAFTFLKSLGFEVGKSLLENDSISLVQELLQSPEGKKIILPQDFACGEIFSPNTQDFIFEANKIPSNFMGLDIGPKTISIFKYYLTLAKTIFWNGPLGVFEFDKFAKGTEMIAQIISKLTKRTVTIVGGGDSAAAVSKFKLENHFSHVSTGGGSFLEYLEGKEMPGLKCIENF
ncbi:MAG: phosphoglycerate kinase [Candidatus Phytoplasma stylosanthis]|uniref:phosphoglycerate kinase n=1 Tax=Candidatus Phytoplasma stylosanthis TaxID=2798314 RepID=UPI002939A004|nr:phosphoglycerate kinase [Candidatus Phytoplasma stylosanthis]MDV3168088.1 phosphoglycerate kinase [Candidatus Phytoplasma stylosanthis]MDV3171091.1 phosphoglycerate kinase [Candidatus Phytoplasma stylosanthis]MDV3173567.1 phosphoglycerate kinase [Candidatus Phytoplasma stylosanthis]MDV3174372.1 phosphoglycerate kinase [Candidatus Phytoplasma stylosanthis]MDV3202473.1 phosphoglycerate kinase [Candidatus Phytoplasma stylosanthis]